MNKVEQPGLKDEMREHFDDEIQLIDYLRVIWKWKWLIILGTLVCMVVAGVVSFNMPKIYEVSIAIEPGIIGVSGDGKFIYIDSLNNIEGKIIGGIYNRGIQEALNINPLENGMKFETGIQKGTNFIKVTSEWEENKIELGLRASEQLAASLSKEYEEIVGQRRGDYTKQILMKQNQIKEVEIQRKDIDKQIFKQQNQIAKIETQRKDIDQQVLFKLNKIEGKKDTIKLRESTINIIGEREKELFQEIKNVKNNTEKIVKQRNNILEHKGNVDDISLLLYSTTIQQNVAYFNQLSDQINRLRKQKMELKTDIEKLGKDIDDINTEIGRLKLNKTEGLQAKIDDVNTEIERIKLHKTEGLQAKINDISTEIGRLKLQKTEGLQAKINDLKLQIDRLSIKNDVIKNIRVIQNPEASISPIKPKKRLNILLAGVIAFMMMMFLAFFVEYIRKAKSNNTIK